MMEFWLTMLLVVAVAAVVLLPTTYLMSRLLVRPAPDFRLFKNSR